MDMVETASQDCILRMESITKKFRGVPAVSDVSFDLNSGEVHCLVGENGAGKSTLIKIMAGSYQADGGRILLDGRPIHISAPLDGLRQGIGVVYQELELLPDLTVMENIALGSEPLTGMRTINWKEVRSRAKAILKRMEVEISESMLVRDLTVAQRQLIAIAKVLSLNPRIVVLDEPSAVLAGKELDTLFELIKDLKKSGSAIVYISHRLEEIFNIGDRVTVLRDGHVIETRQVAETTESELIALMVGRKVETRFPPRPESVTDKVLLEVDHLSTDFLQDISFSLRAGEILGVAGLVGSGQNVLARALSGLERVRGGKIIIDGRQFSNLTPRRALAAGIGLVPEDRKSEGLVLMHSVFDNATYSILERFTRFRVLNQTKLLELVEQYRNSLSIKVSSLDQPVGSLSGGNQQKVVMAKALSTNPKVLILDEPTRGVDVGAKAEFYQLIVDLAARGHAILLISSELAEVMSLSHRIIVLADGQLSAVMDPPYDDKEILRKALSANRQVS